MRIWVLSVVLVAACAAAQADRISNHATLPPEEGAGGKSVGLDQGTVSQAISAAVPAVFDNFAGQNALLATKAQAAGKALQVGVGHAVELSPAQLYTRREVIPTGFRYTGAVSSLDAQALRVRMNLNALEAGERLWVIDPLAASNFGPYTVADHTPGGRWLPVIEGETVVVVVESPEARLPQATVTGLSHFFRSLTGTGGADLAKQLSCNINVACEPNATLQDVSTGVGVIVSTSGGFDSAICSGTLINNDLTAAFEPYFMTAAHCVSTQLEALQIDVIWDFRSTQCGSDDSPLLGDLPRSSGRNLLDTDVVLDLSLIELDDVPNGAYGRTYVGYDATMPSVPQSVVILSFPKGTAMRIAYGEITDLDVTRFSWGSQYRVDWDLGVTENGSSGGGLFNTEDEYRFIGVLSNGPQHSCSNTSGNIDYFGSLARYFDQVEPWLGSDNPPNGGGIICPAQTAFAAEPTTLAALRTFRDKGLALTQTGRTAVAAYYWLSPALVRWVDEDAAHRDWFQRVSRPVAQVGAWLE